MSAKENIKLYLVDNYWRGFRNDPLQSWPVSVLAMVIYCVLAMITGFAGGLFEVGVVQSKITWLLPVTLFVFPSFLEESVFRGLLIPNNARDRGKGFVVGITLMSSLLFVAWHPLNAMTINPGARVLFLDPNFLLITFFLGVACSTSYIYSRSLWAPVILHWLTVVIWVMLLGGRNLILT